MFLNIAKRVGSCNRHEGMEAYLDSAKCVVVAWSKRPVGHEGRFVRDEADVRNAATPKD